MEGLLHRRVDCPQILESFWQLFFCDDWWCLFFHPKITIFMGSINHLAYVFGFPTLISWLPASCVGTSATFQKQQPAMDGSYQQSFWIFGELGCVSSLWGP